jgi:hypothetical protein
MASGSLVCVSNPVGKGGAMKKPNRKKPANKPKRNERERDDEQ